MKEKDFEKHLSLQKPHILFRMAEMYDWPLEGQSGGPALHLRHYLTCTSKLSIMEIPTAPHQSILPL